jgi:hypothetical protein
MVEGGGVAVDSDVIERARALTSLDFADTDWRRASRRIS